MKKYSNIYTCLVDQNTIWDAYYLAKKRKALTNNALIFQINEEENLNKLHTELLNKSYIPNNYNTFKIFEPKERIIAAASFRDRIVHHAIILSTEEYFEKFQIYHSYACRKNKGTHKAILYALNKSKKYKYYLKMDIRKYFDSVNHTILKEKLRLLFYDVDLLNLLDKIIDSYEIERNLGIPIGNLTSQYYANYYLGFMDHFIKEELQVKPYVRYMDDFLLFSNNIAQLNLCQNEIEKFVRVNLELDCKRPIINSTSNGISFLGFLIKPKGIYLLSEKKKAVIKKLNLLKKEFQSGYLSEEQYAARLSTIFSYLEFARSLEFRKMIL